MNWEVYETPSAPKAKNVIFLVGDGLSVAHRTAARLMSKGMAGAIAVIAMSARGTMHVNREVFYMDKIAVGPGARDAIDINAPVKENIARVAKALGKRHLSDAKRAAGDGSAGLRRRAQMRAHSQAMTPAKAATRKSK